MQAKSTTTAKTQPATPTPSNQAMIANFLRQGRFCEDCGHLTPRETMVGEKCRECAEC